MRETVGVHWKEMRCFARFSIENVLWGRSVKRLWGPLQQRLQCPRSRTRAETLHPHCSSMAMKSPAQPDAQRQCRYVRFPSEKLGMDLLVSKQCLPWTMARGGRKCAASVRFPERGEADVAAEKRFGAVLPAFGIFHPAARCRARRASGRQRARTRMSSRSLHAPSQRRRMPRRAGPQGSGGQFHRFRRKHRQQPRAAFQRPAGQAGDFRTRAAGDARTRPFGVKTVLQNCRNAGAHNRRKAVWM